MDMDMVISTPKSVPSILKSVKKDTYKVSLKIVLECQSIHVEFYKPYPIILQDHVNVCLKKKTNTERRSGRQVLNKAQTFMHALVLNNVVNLCPNYGTG